MSGYRNQRTGSSGRPNSSASYEPYYSRNNRYQGTDAAPQSSNQQPASSSSSGSTYKPSFSSRYQGASGVSGATGATGSGYHRRPVDGQYERERNTRDRYTPRNNDHHSNGYRRDIYISGREGRDQAPPRNTYNSYGNSYRDRAERDRTERASTSSVPSYSSYEDRRQRELSSWYPSYSRPNVPSRNDPSRRSGEVDLLDYDSSEPRADPSSTQRQPLPPQSHVVQQQYHHSPAKSRPSLIPKDFNEHENDYDDEDAMLENAVRDSISSNVDSSDLMSGIMDTIPKPSESQNADIADRIPLSVEHKEELDNESEESKETTAEPSVGPLESVLDTSEHAPVDDEVIDEAKITPDKDNEKAEEKSDEKVVEEKVEVNIEENVEERAETFDESDYDSSDSYDPDSYDPETFETKPSAAIVESTPQASRVEPLQPSDELPASSDDIEMKESPPATPEKSPQVLETSEENVEASLPVETHKATIPQPLTSLEISPLVAPDSAIFPLNKLEQRVWELKNHTLAMKHLRLPYLLQKPVRDFKDYPFYERNFLVHQQGVKPRLIEQLMIIKGTTFSRKINLLNEYAHRSRDWNRRCADMENQLKVLYPQSQHEEEESKEESEIPAPVQDSRNSRRSRHGDTVRSEAEFMEILQNLEKEKEEDPLYRAQQVAADIPDMILNPMEKAKTLLDLNNLVTDKEAWANRIHTDAYDNFTPREHEMFCEAFLAHPKKFGRISALMGGLRTPEECVLHYYKTKKLVTDYKQLLALKKRKGKGKPRGRRAKLKSSANTPTSETPGDSGDELNLENFVPNTNEELFTETGRRRRAAAPVFDKKDDAPDERKRSLESSGSGVDEATGKMKKKPRGPKGKRLLAPADTNGPSVQEGLESNQSNDPDGKGKNPISSYWCVRDIGIFYHWLSQVGPDWTLIASKLGTKTPIMVRNYYTRNADSHGWKNLVNEIEQKKKEGNLPEPVDMPASSDIHAQHPEQSHHPAQPPRNPPLGFFTSPTNVPSNVEYASHPPLGQLPHMQHQQHQPVPTLQNVSVPNELQRLPLLPGGAYQDNEKSVTIKREGLKPFLPPTSTFNWGKPEYSGLQSNGVGTSTQGVPITSNAPSTRAGAFSITSLLNPPSSQASQQPVPSFPLPGTFSSVPEKREFFSSSYGTPKSNGFGPSSRVNILNDGPLSNSNGPSIAVQPNQNQSQYQYQYPRANDNTSSASSTSNHLNPIDGLINSVDQNKQPLVTNSNTIAAPSTSTSATPAPLSSSGPSFPGRSILNPAADAPRRPGVYDLLNDDNGN